MVQIPAFYFLSNELTQISSRLRAKFSSAEPFAHVVIDSFLPADVAGLLAREFPKRGAGGWRRWGGGPGGSDAKEEDKVGISDEEHFGPFTRHFMGQLCSATFIRFVEEVSGCCKLSADPTFNGCGLHSTGRGASLAIHSDADRHPHGTPYLQAINAIVYITEGWKEEYSGELEFWNSRGDACVKRIQPLFNRMVLFRTDESTFHGHPAPVRCPEGVRRNSLASYYYVMSPGSEQRRRPTWVGSRANVRVP